MLCKPIAIGCAILELAKLTMYRFYYEASYFLKISIIKMLNYVFSGFTKKIWVKNPASLY